MFTWIDMLLIAIVVAAVTAFTILFLLGSSLQEREGQAYREGYRKGQGNRTEPSANGDKIRAMTDAELAEKILRIDLGEALEKQIAKKPIWSTSDFANIHHCPSCDGIVWVEQPHCGYCGQRLDWRNEDAE
jgi:hypothetical protein